MMRLARDGQDRRHYQKKISGKNSARAPVTITPLCAQIDSLANSHAEAQIAAGREPQTMGLNFWSNVTL
jgi:hypothetical protein